MLKKMMFVFMCLILAGGFIFSQEAENEENNFPKNTITVDAAITGFSLLTWGLMGHPVFFTAAQYERQITDAISLAGRFDFRMFDLPSSYDSGTTMTAFSAEGHIRYYPKISAFFLDGMLGYAMFNYRTEAIHSLSHYLKLGARLGWRIDFGKPGGFVLEPSFGYNFAFGDSNINIIKGTDETSTFFNQLLNLIYGSLIKGFFVGGPQISLGLGYRF
jgi:hypothetical protein